MGTCDTQQEGLNCMDIFTRKTTKAQKNAGKMVYLKESFF